MDTDALFKVLEPPPGGPEQFARKLDRLAGSGSPGRTVWAAAATIALFAVLAALMLREPDDQTPQLVAGAPPSVDVYNAPELDRLLGRPVRPTEVVVTVNTETVAVTELDSSSQQVRIYQIN